MKRRTQLVIGVLVGVGVLAGVGVAGAMVLSRPPPGGPTPPSPPGPSPVPTPPPLPPDLAILVRELEHVPTFKPQPGGPTNYMVDRVVAGKVETIGGQAVDAFVGDLKMGYSGGFA